MRSLQTLSSALARGEQLSTQERAFVKATDARETALAAALKRAHPIAEHSAPLDVPSGFALMGAAALEQSDSFIRREYRKQCATEAGRLHGMRSRLIASVFFSAWLDYGSTKDARDAAFEFIGEADYNYAKSNWSGFLRFVARVGRNRAATIMDKGVFSNLAKSDPAPAKKAKPVTVADALDGSGADELAGALSSVASGMVGGAVKGEGDAIVDVDGEAATIDVTAALGLVEVLGERIVAIEAERDALALALQTERARSTRLAEELDAIRAGAARAASAAAVVTH